MFRSWWTIFTIATFTALLSQPLGLAKPLYTKPAAKTIIPPVARATAEKTNPPYLFSMPSYETLIDGTPHKLFITIDDHPGRKTTQYLDALKAAGVKATFFIVSYPLYGYISTPHYVPAIRMVDSLKRALQEGHVLGNHSVSHRLVCRMDRRTVEWEIGKTQAWTKRVLGVDMKLWRPPNGHLCPLVQKVAAEHKLTTVMWDVDDWRSTTNSMVRIIKIRARRSMGHTIVLFHNKINKFVEFLKLLPPRPDQTEVKN